MNKNIVTRFAPSPTGMMHVGSLRTALYSYLWARHNGGKFILRIEDTDRERFVPGAIEQIVRTLNWAGFDYDEGPVLTSDGKIQERGQNGPYIQSKRTAIYREYTKQLIDHGHAYRCFCTREDLEAMRTDQQQRGVPPMYDRRCLQLTEQQIKQKLDQKTPYVVRLKVPRDGYTVFKDVIRKRVQFENKLVDDQVLLKSDGFPTYHLAVVIDDHLMGVTDIIRGEEWLSSTPKHIFLYQAFRWPVPSYAHLPLLVDRERKKLSKRRGDVAVDDYIKKGYLKDAILNFIVLLGWNPKTAEEIFTLPELVKRFELAQVHKAAAVFDLEKLNWVNGKYLRTLPVPRVRELSEQYLCSLPGYQDYRANTKFIEKAIALEQSRIKKLSDLPEAIGFFFSEKLDYDPAQLVWRKSDRPKTILAMQKALDRLELFTEADFVQAKLEPALLAFAKEQGIDNGTMFWPLRFALSGKERSPSPFEIMGVLGKTQSLRRIQSGLNRLKK